ncbi:DUF309 domain-containing protein [Alicyclobacillus herbarius]|uniref:DUF309 domain-containing protein n=1 Tax=Alicyclobacillus herbarius TaxID=122960 RepID=UPI00040F251B|nr:DUF309 domain-containing protein [Alicyclobacillus herbarius]
MEPRLEAYVYDFNVRKDYFACHEHLESLWLDSGRPEVMKGLIQAAVCLYHLESGNIRGAMRMWTRGRPRLVQAAPDALGLDIRQLVADLDGVFARIPDSWRSKVVDATQVESLGLPQVRLRVLRPKPLPTYGKRKP